MSNTIKVSNLLYPDPDAVPENFVSGLVGEGVPSQPTKSLTVWFVFCIILQRGSNCLIQRKLKNFQSGVRMRQRMAVLFFRGHFRTFLDLKTTFWLSFYYFLLCILLFLHCRHSLFKQKFSQKFLCFFLWFFLCVFFFIL